MPTVEISSSLERALRRGHPWIYRKHVPRGFEAPPGWVRVKSGRFTGYAIWDETSSIALRVFSARGVPDEGWFRECVARAWQLRTAIRGDKTNAFRWLYGEGDGLPGVTVDVYGSFATIVLYADALKVLLPDLVSALASTTALSGITLRHSSGLKSVWGQSPPRELIVEECGMRLYVDLYAAQKTGLFLDHRDNRQFVRRLSRDLRVLNLFAYTGAFSVATALGGASSVTSVDAAAAAVARARDNFCLNALDPEGHEFVDCDVFEYLEKAQTERKDFDLVICDPPSFAKSKEQAFNARRAYVRLNASGLAVTRREGLYAAASCTSLIGPEQFRDILADSAALARRRLQIVHEAGHALDHPVMAHHPEGRYLKFVVGRVLDQNA